jgi:hypothetical protein
MHLEGPRLRHALPSDNRHHAHARQHPRPELGLAAHAPPLRPLVAHQPAARQDRFVTLAPLVSVLLFLAAIISAFWYLRNEEIERETESVKRDTEIVQQQLRLHLIENQEQLVRMASELVKRETDIDDFAGQAQTFMRERPAVTQLAWLDGNRKRKAARWAMPYREELAPGDGAPMPRCPAPPPRARPNWPSHRPATCASRCIRRPSSTTSATR